VRAQVCVCVQHNPRNEDEEGLRPIGAVYDYDFILIESRIEFNVLYNSGVRYFVIQFVNRLNVLQFWNDRNTWPYIMSNMHSILYVMFDSTCRSITIPIVRIFFFMHVVGEIWLISTIFLIGGIISSSQSDWQITILFVM